MRWRFFLLALFVGVQLVFVFFMLQANNSTIFKKPTAQQQAKSSNFSDHVARLLIGMTTVRRKGDMPYLQQTLASIQAQIPEMWPYDVRVHVVNTIHVADGTTVVPDQEHKIFEQASHQFPAPFYFTKVNTEYEPPESRYIKLILINFFKLQWLVAIRIWKGCAEYALLFIDKLVNHDFAGLLNNLAPQCTDYFMISMCKL